MSRPPDGSMAMLSPARTFRASAPVAPDEGMLQITPRAAKFADSASRIVGFAVDRNFPDPRLRIVSRLLTIQLVSMLILGLTPIAQQHSTTKPQSLSSSTVLSRQAASEMPVKVHLCGSTCTSNYSRGATLSVSCSTMTANFQPSFPLCSK